MPDEARENPPGAAFSPAPPEPAPPRKPFWPGMLLAAGVAAVLLCVAALGILWLRESLRRQQCYQTIRAIGCVCHLYADENDENFPQNWQQFYPSMIDNAKVFSCPSKPSSYQDFAAGKVTEASYSYILLPGRWAALPADFFLIYEKPENHGQGFHVLYLDCRTVWWKAQDADKFFAELKAQEAQLPELRKEWEQQNKAAPPAGPPPH